MHGWRRAQHDPRDYKLAVSAVVHPPVLSLRSLMPAVRNQLNIGSCTANGGAVMAEFVIWKETAQMPAHFSRLDLYAITRELEGTPLSEDSGCNVRNVCKALRKWGICYETTWPYVPAKFSVNPPRAAAVEALHHRATSFHLVSGLAGIRQCIADGYPMIFGFDCFESLMSDEVGRTGIVPMPGTNDQGIGGHCVTCVGYNDSAGMLEFQNSWGTDWGDNGFGWLPYDYVTQHMASDFVTLRRETTQ